jgi:hypothetical protein
MRTFTVSIPGGRIGNFLAGAAVASVIGGTAIAITDTSFTYSKPKLGFYSLSPSDLQPGSSHEADFYWNNSGGALSSTERDQGGCFYTGVHLPQGVRLIAVTSYYQSARTNFHPSVKLTRYGFEVQNQILFSHNIEDNSNQRKSVKDSIPANGSVVRNDLYVYRYSFCLTVAPNGSADIFYGARFTYEYSSAGD